MTADTERPAPLVYPPKLRTGEDRSASRLELFFDLAYVLVVAELVGAFIEDLTWHGAVVFAGLFSVTWWSWVTTTLYANQGSSRLEPDAHRGQRDLRAGPLGARDRHVPDRGRAVAGIGAHAGQRLESLTGAVLIVTGAILLTTTFITIRTAKGHQTTYTPDPQHRPGGATRLEPR